VEPLLSRLTNDIALVRGALAPGSVQLDQERAPPGGLPLLDFWTSWRLALVSLFVVPPSVFLIVWLGKKLRRRSTITQERMADLNSILQETLTGIRVVKAFSMEEFEKKKFGKAPDYFRSFVSSDASGRWRALSRDPRRHRGRPGCSGTEATNPPPARASSPSSSSSSSSRCSSS
jgi:subfamily B ATP-binding cassette protein MsbA